MYIVAVGTAKFIFLILKHPGNFARMNNSSSSCLRFSWGISGLSRCELYSSQLSERRPMNILGFSVSKIGQEVTILKLSLPDRRSGAFENKVQAPYLHYASIRTAAENACVHIFQNREDLGQTLDCSRAVLRTVQEAWY